MPNGYFDPTQAYQPGPTRAEMPVARPVVRGGGRMILPPPIMPTPSPTPLAFNGPAANGEGPAPGTLVASVGPTEAPPGPGEEWLWPLLALGLGWLIGEVTEENGNGQPGTDVVPQGYFDPAQALGGGVTPVGLQVMGSNWEAFADFGGFGKGSSQAEGWIAANRTTHGTGVISAETFRGWDPIQQRYYQLHGKNPYSDITLMPGRVLPGIGGFITKTWVTHAWRKDGSLASTQMAMTSTGRMISLSETGIMKNWRPYRSIVIGKSLTTRNLRRVSTRVKSHAKSLKKILSILK